MASVSLRLPDEVTERLDKLASITGRSKTFFMIEAIKDHLDDLEGLYLAESELIAIRSGQSSTASLENMLKRYGLQD